MPTNNGESSALIHEFLGSAHVFASTVRSVVEERLLGSIVGGRLTFPQYKLLRLVARTDGHSIGEVASFLGVTNAAASKAVDKLVRRRFIRRAESKPDRRAMHLSLTDQGRHVVESYEDLRNQRVAVIFQEFPADELRKAADLLDRLSVSLVGHGASPDDMCLQCGIYFRDKCLVRQLVRRHCFYARGERGDGTTGADGMDADATRADARVRPGAKARRARGGRPSGGP